MAKNKSLYLQMLNQGQNQQPQVPTYGLNPFSEPQATINATALGGVDFSPSTREPINMPNLPQYPEQEIKQSLDNYMSKREEAADNYGPLREALKGRQTRDQELLEQLSGQDIKTSQAVDISPTMALVDSLTGSNLSAGYNAPDILDQRTSQANQLENSLRNQAGRPEETAIEQAKFEALNEKESMDQLRQMFNDKVNAQYKNAGAQAALARWTGQRDQANKPKKMKELSQANIKNINEGNAIPAMLEDVSKVIDDNSKEFGPLSGSASLMNPYNTKVQAINAQMRASSQAFGRFMEGGVLRKEDEEKYKKMFPSVSDTPGLAKEKLNVVNRLLVQKQNSLIDAYKKQGFNLDGVDKDLQVPSISQTISKEEDLESLTDEEIMEMSKGL